MKHEISFFEYHNGKWQFIGSESYWNTIDARSRFFNAISTMQNAASATKVVWKDAGKVAGKFSCQKTI